MPPPQYAKYALLSSKPNYFPGAKGMRIHVHNSAGPEQSRTFFLGGGGGTAWVIERNKSELVLTL